MYSTFFEKKIEESVTSLYLMKIFDKAFDCFVPLIILQLFKKGQNYIQVRNKDFRLMTKRVCIKAK